MSQRLLAATAWWVILVMGAVFTFALTALASGPQALAAGAAQAQAASESAPGGALVARALETHTSQRHGVTLVVFRQRDKSDGPRLGQLLRQHDGAPVEFETSDGRSHTATVFRLSTCFGRGLLVFPAGSAELPKREQFWLKFPK